MTYQAQGHITNIIYNMHIYGKLAILNSLQTMDNDAEND